MPKAKTQPKPLRAASLFSCAEFPKTLTRNLSSAPGLFLFHLFLASKRSTKTKQKLVKCLSQKGAVWAWLA